MTTECVQHPEDPSRWLPVDEAIGTVWRNVLSALATGQSLDANLAALRSILGDVQARAKASDERMDALTADVAARLATLTERLDSQQAGDKALRAEVDTLKARVAELEPKPELTGPQFGVDVSGHQTLAQVEAAAADPANAFVIVKATEGMTWKSDVYASQYAAIAKAGKMTGAYHFAWCNQDAATEAGNFLAHSMLLPGDLVALDLERETAGETWTVRVAYALAWIEKVAAATGATPLVYVNWSWIKGLRTAATAAQWAKLTSSSVVWLAEWTGVAGKHSTVTSKDGTNPDSWPILIHQYGVVDNLDRNWTPDIAALRKVAVP